MLLLSWCSFSVRLHRCCIYRRWVGWKGKSLFSIDFCHHFDYAYRLSNCRFSCCIARSPYTISTQFSFFFFLSCRAPLAQLAIFTIDLYSRETLSLSLPWVYLYIQHLASRETTQWIVLTLFYKHTLGYICTSSFSFFFFLFFIIIIIIIIVIFIFVCDGSLICSNIETGGQEWEFFTCY